MKSVAEYIPTGSRNAVSRSRLACLAGMTDRQLRRAIHNARREVPIINLSDGGGYYIPDMTDEADRAALEQYVKQEESRLKSIGWSLLASRRMLKGQNGERK